MAVDVSDLDGVWVGTGPPPARLEPRPLEASRQEAQDATMRPDRMGLYPVLMDGKAWGNVHIRPHPDRPGNDELVFECWGYLDDGADHRMYLEIGNLDEVWHENWPDAPSS